MPRAAWKHRVVAVTVATLVLAPAAACSDDDQATTASSSTTTAAEDANVGAGGRQPALDGTISVLASDSLLEVLPLLVDRFQALNDGVEVTVRYGPDLDLAVELGDGVPADVFLASDEGSMAAVAAANRIDGSPKAVSATDELNIKFTAATLSPSDNQMAARAFVEFVVSS